MNSIKQQLLRESEVDSSIRFLARSINERLGKNLVKGSTWVRLRPPDGEELVDCDFNSKLVRFHRVGALVTIENVVDPFVEILCGGSTMMWFIDAFFESWVKAIRPEEWGNPTIKSVGPPMNV